MKDVKKTLAVEGIVVLGEAAQKTTNGGSRRHHTNWAAIGRAIGRLFGTFA